MAIVIQRTDGGVSIMRPEAWEDVAVKLEKWKRTHVGEYVSHHEVDEADIPTDRSFRNAWTRDGKTVAHDMEKCRNIHRERLRLARAPKLAALDVEYQRADEADDKAAKVSIAKQKQSLRDVTADPRIDAATTPEELKAVWPL